MIYNLHQKRYILLFILILISGLGYSQVKEVAELNDILSTHIVYLHYNKDEKYADVLRIPVVSAAYPNLKKALCDTGLFDGRTLAEVIKAYKSHEPGITGSEYQVTFFNKDVISIIIRNETMGAYPDSYEKWLTLNIHTGKPYTIANEITPAGMAWALNNYKILMKKRIASDKQGRTDEDQETVDELNQTIDSLTLNDFGRKYVFTKTGIKFSIEQILPHVIRSQEPDRDWEVKYGIFKAITAPAALILKR